ncbi:unnamed protein product [Mytilus edulis]|uniref:Uncharacterized protein n=1 Tax=Mytilus edulis TaxID=6550 RepID=A0A8S3UAS8_MYTED|nr:unnamed protein product [Mytilus edulis]
MNRKRFRRLVTQNCYVRRRFKRIFTYLILIVGCCVYLLKKSVPANVLMPCEFETVAPDKAVLKLLQGRQVKCRMWQPFAYINQSGHLHLNRTAINNANFSIREFKCDYRSILMDGLNAVKLSPRVKFIEPVFVYNEFIYVICNITNGNTVYSNFHFNLNPKVNKRKILNEATDQLSVVIIGFDSVSRFVAEQKLPKTLDFFENSLGAYPIKGFTRIGDNTLPNLLAVLTGKTVLESILTARTIPVLFQEVLSRGYIDCYAEDWAPYLVPFVAKYPNYTHYFRSVILANENKDLHVSQLSSVTMKHIKLSTNPICIGNEFKHKIIFEYSKQCFEKYKKKRKYVFMWNNQVSHHNPQSLSLADEDTKQFIEWMNSTGNLKNTVLLVMSDHGPRYGKFAQTDFGRITRNNPLLSIYIPHHVKETFPTIAKNLKVNKNRLTTPFDLYETLKDIISSNLEKREKENNLFNSRGTSLFREIHKQRSCYEASIGESYCPCYASQPTSLADDTVQLVTIFAVDWLNQIITDHNVSCAHLKLKSVKSARIQFTPSLRYDRNEHRYIINFYTYPGNGLFQAIVLKDVEKISLLGNVDRLNEYGNQSSCIPEKLAHTGLRKYCYCQS